mmetsp:Transcript_28823/g.112314  ORF Transcript_28823/g.112314 Transcript_28823/m.112314 type:complete len:100 (-) Transcript_28823:717-1016(-)
MDGRKRAACFFGVPVVWFGFCEEVPLESRSVPQESPQMTNNGEDAADFLWCLVAEVRKQLLFLLRLIRKLYQVASLFSGNFSHLLGDFPAFAVLWRVPC